MSSAAPTARAPRVSFGAGRAVAPLGMGIAVLYMSIIVLIPLAALTAKELHETGSHELLNWLVLLGAVSPARARVRFFGEMGRIDLAALEWQLA